MTNRSRYNSNPARIVIILLVFVLIFGSVVLVVANNSSSSSDLEPAKNAPVSKALQEQLSKVTFNVSQPAKIPEGYARTNVHIIDAQASGFDCAEVAQLYNKSETDIDDGTDSEQFTEELQKEASIGYIDVYSYAEDCSFPRPEDAETYEVGDYSGWISDSNSKESVLIELTVNQAMVRVETDLSSNQIKPVLEKFVPFSTTPPPDTITIEDD